MAPGTGKTLTAIRSVEEFPVLVICRRDDFLTWRLELEAEGWGEDWMYFIDAGDADLPEVEDRMYVATWYFVTYDLVKNPRIFDWIKAQQFAHVIADECHMIKRWKSTRTKKVYRATRHIPRKIAMTGTPITNELRDIWSQALFIDNGKTFGNNEWYFLKQYYIKEGYGWYKKRTSKDLIAQKLKKLAFAVHEDDVLKLPPPRSIIKAVPMTGMQRRFYEQVLQEWELTLSSGQTLEIDQVIVQLAKLRQIAAGFYYEPVPGSHPDPRKQQKIAVRLKCSKLELLRSMMLDEDYLASKPKVVIWAAHTAEISRICEMLADSNIEYVPFFGRMNRRARERVRMAFRDEKKVRAFVGQVDSGVGMNELVVADTAVYYANSFRVVSKQQSMRRIRRRGSERHERITYWELVTENTVDLPLLNNLGRSMDLASYILDQLKRGVSLRRLVA